MWQSFTFPPFESKEGKMHLYGNPQANQGNYQGNGGQPNYSNQNNFGQNQNAYGGQQQANFGQYMTPEQIFKMSDPALAIGSEMIKKQREKWMPGISDFVSSLKYYFAVNNVFVLKKLTMILYPAGNKVWNRLSADEFQRDGEVTAKKLATPKDDPNAPDLYIPLMAFMTYVLLYGFCRSFISKKIFTPGLSVSSHFTPDLIIQTIWRCLLLQIVEACLIKFGLNMLSVFSLPFLDIFAYTGYKYVGLCLNTISKLFGGTINFLVSLYTASMLAYFVLKSMAAVVPPNTTTGPPRHLMLLGFAILQFLVMLFLSYF